VVQGSDAGLSTVRKLSILLVEDNPDHAALLRITLQYDQRVARIEWVCEPTEAFERLRHGDFDLVLLDLDLGLTSGFDVLMGVKADAALRRTPVVILSTSDAPRDRRRAYDLHANSYVVKPVDGRQMGARLADVIRYWAVCDAGAALRQ